MEKNNTLKTKEKKSSKKKKFMKMNTLKYFNRKKNGNLVINISSYNRMAKKTKNKRINSTIKNNKNICSTDKNIAHKYTILYRKFLEFKFINKFKSKEQKKENSKNAKAKKDNSFFSSRRSYSQTSSNLNNSKRKFINKITKMTNPKKEEDKNIPNSGKKNSSKIINKTELFNIIINSKKKEKDEEFLDNQNIKRNQSYKNFNNIDLVNKSGIQSKSKNTKLFTKNKKQKKYDMTLNLVSKNYFEKMKFNKYKYYNDKNENYVKRRRQRVEEKVNEILFEKYKEIRPLRMTERVFFIDEEYKSDKNNHNENNKNNFDNNMCKVLDNNNIVNRYNYYFYINNIKENKEDNNQNNEENNKNFNNNKKNNNNKNNNNNQNNKNRNKNKKRKIEQKNENSNQITYYNNQINNIVKMRRSLSIEDFFRGFRRDYNLLDFNFTFLLPQCQK